MLNNVMPGITDATAGCTISKTGLCKDCPRFRSMPVEVTDPTTGKKIPTNVWDCVDAWAMLGAWDAGRQAQGVHAAVNRSETETTRRQDQLLHLVATGTVGEAQVKKWNERLSQSSDSDTRSKLASAPPESLPSSQEPA